MPREKGKAAEEVSAEAGGAGDELLNQILIGFKNSDNTADYVVQIFETLSPKLDPRSRRYLHLTSQEVQGEINEGGRPPRPVAPSFARVQDSLHGGHDFSEAVRIEARHLSRKDGGKVDSHRRWLERVLKELDKTP